MSLLSKTFRAKAGAGDRIRDAGLSPPPGLAIYRDLPYLGRHSKYNLLDVYHPLDAAQPLPVIVSVHGGGYVYGDKEVYQFYCMSLAQRGFAVVNFNYHLAPEHKFPTQLTELNAVLLWMTQHAARYQLDLGNVFLVGDSAGAQLASHYAAIYSNPQFAELFPFAVPAGVTIRALGLNCGMYDLATAAMAPREGHCNNIYDDYMGKDRARLRPMMEVLAAIGPGYPPAFVMTSYYDFLRKEAEPMARLLQERGVEAEYHLYGAEGQKHMGHVFHCNVRLDEARACNDAECAFFRKWIRH